MFTTAKEFEVMPDHYILAASKYEGDPVSLFQKLSCDKVVTW